MAGEAHMPQAAWSTCRASNSDCIAATPVGSSEGAASHSVGLARSLIGAYASRGSAYPGKSLQLGRPIDTPARWIAKRHSGRFGALQNQSMNERQAKQFPSEYDSHGRPMSRAHMPSAPPRDCGR
jgi:hypothetical protein